MPYICSFSLSTKNIVLQLYWGLLALDFKIYTFFGCELEGGKELFKDKVLR